MVETLGFEYMGRRRRRRIGWRVRRFRRAWARTYQFLPPGTPPGIRMFWAKRLIARGIVR